MWFRTAAAQLSFVACAFVACADSSSDDASEPPPGVAPHDVSLLFPLPAREGGEELLTFDDAGAQGSLLPMWAITALPQLADEEQSHWAWTQLRVVAVRFDPCFSQVADGPECKNQIRLVWQPVADDPADVKTTTTMDAAVHSFYELPRAELLALVQDLRTASGGRTTNVLDVHPALKEQGPAGAFAALLKQRLLQSVGERRLTRVTFMTIPVDQHQWLFGGFHVVGGKATTLFPAGLTDNRQQIDGDAVAAQPLDVRIQPGIANEDVRPLLEAKTLPATEAELAAADAAYSAALRLEDPRVHSVENTDCASCHLAGPARLSGESRFGFVSDGRDAHATRITHAPASPLSFRGFGYFGSAPSISARAAHETEEVLSLVTALGVK